jgi:DNA mismatch endonuclease, patch repair protein
MADVFSKEKRSRVMSAIRSGGNKGTELKLVSVLRASGVTGWRRRQPLPGRPDFIFRHERLAVFVDGCFWHGCPKHGRRPGSNRNYWLPKLRRNQERDGEVRRALLKAGWAVLRVWEHDLGNASRVARRIAAALDRARTRLHSAHK